MTDFRALCAELVDALEDWIAYGDEVDIADAHQLVDRARAALAAADGPAVQNREPASVTAEPSDEELLEMTEDWPATTGPRHDLSGCPEVPLYSVFEDEVIEFARAVLARWGTAATQPIPVSERLSEAGDCDAEGRCWWFDPAGDGGWYLDLYQGNYTHWLPAPALPLPSGEVQR
jgi:hypothetical protein